MTKMSEVPTSLEGLLAWRCGYATGLRVALRILGEAKEPERRIHREIHASIVEARGLYLEVRPDLKLN